METIRNCGHTNRILTRNNKHRFLNLVCYEHDSYINELSCSFLLCYKHKNINTNKMKIKIKKHDIELQYCMRMYLKYEERTGRGLSFDNMTTYTGITELLYCAIVATLEHKKYRKLGLTLTWEEFLDWTDEQQSNKIFEQFNEWLLSVIQSQKDQTAEEEQSSDERDPN